MDLFSVFNISASGLDYQMLRLETIANNMANVGATRSSSGGPLYKPLEAVARSNGTEFSQYLGSEGNVQLSGVGQVELVPKAQPYKYVYSPNHPDANADGYVEMPNVNPVNEMVGLVEATRAYEANVRVMNAAKLLVTKALEIGR